MVVMARTVKNRRKKNRRTKTVKKIKQIGGTAVEDMGKIFENLIMVELDENVGVRDLISLYPKYKDGDINLLKRAIKKMHPAKYRDVNWNTNDTNKNKLAILNKHRVDAEKDYNALMKRIEDKALFITNDLRKDATDIVIKNHKTKNLEQSLDIIATERAAAERLAREQAAARRPVSAKTLLRPKSASTEETLEPDPNSYEMQSGEQPFTQSTQTSKLPHIQNKPNQKTNPEIKLQHVQSAATRPVTANSRVKLPHVQTTKAGEDGKAVDKTRRMNLEITPATIAPAVKAPADAGPLALPLPPPVKAPADAGPLALPLPPPAKAIAPATIQTGVKLQPETAKTPAKIFRSQSAPARREEKVAAPKIQEEEEEEEDDKRRPLELTKLQNTTPNALTRQKNAATKIQKNARGIIPKKKLALFKAEKEAARLQEAAAADATRLEATRLQEATILEATRLEAARLQQVEDEKAAAARLEAVRLQTIADAAAAQQQQQQQAAKAITDAAAARKAAATATITPAPPPPVVLAAAVITPPVITSATTKVDAAAGLDIDINIKPPPINLHPINVTRLKELPNNTMKALYANRIWARDAARTDDEKSIIDYLYNKKDNPAIIPDIKTIPINSQGFDIDKFDGNNGHLLVDQAAADVPDTTNWALIYPNVSYDDGVANYTYYRKIYSV